jgi:hypothetical protein
MLIRGVYVDGWRRLDTPVADHKKESFVARVQHNFSDGILNDPDAVVAVVFRCSTVMSRKGRPRKSGSRRRSRCGSCGRSTDRRGNYVAAQASASFPLGGFSDFLSLSGKDSVQGDAGGGRAVLER